MAYNSIYCVLYPSRTKRCRWARTIYTHLKGISLTWTAHELQGCVRQNVFYRHRILDWIRQKRSNSRLTWRHRGTHTSGLPCILSSLSVLSIYGAGSRTSPSTSASMANLLMFLFSSTIDGTSQRLDEEYLLEPTIAN